MKYIKPEFTATGSALALVQLQSVLTKCGLFVDRPDLQIICPTNGIADPPAYEADE